jgi:hypothetical protein
VTAHASIERLDCSIKAEDKIDLNAGRNVLGARTIDVHMTSVKRIKAARRSKAARQRGEAAASNLKSAAGTAAQRRRSVSKQP